MMVNEICEKKYNKPLSGCTNKEIYYALLDMTKDLAAKKESEAGKKKVYYISAEFLIGKLLSNNLINLGLYKIVKEELEAAGKDIGEIEEIEPGTISWKRWTWPSGSMLFGFHGNIKSAR